MSVIGRLFGRRSGPPVSLVMTYRNDTAAPQRVSFEPLGVAFVVEPNRMIEVFDHSPPEDPFVRIDNKGDVVVIYRWMTADLTVKCGGRPLEPTPPLV